MGRRAKHKQGDPTPLQGDAGFVKAQKRKADKIDDDGEEGNAKRSPKKSKSAVTNRAHQKNVVSNGKEKKKGIKGKDTKKVKGKGKEEAGSDDEDSLGWEDVEDDGDLQAHAA